jgi:hypothetical protein
VQFIPLKDIWSMFTRRKGGYHYNVDLINASTSFKSLGREEEKLAAVLTNPACMKVFALQCDLFSLAEVSVADVDSGEDIEDDPFLSLIRNPNPLSSSTQAQFLWDYMFWSMIGTAYCYVDSRIVDRTPRNVMYFLNPCQIEWPKEFEQNRDKLFLTEKEVQKLGKILITYRYADGTKFEFPYDRLMMSFDLTNGIGNQFKGCSRLDALYKIISNSEHVLDSQNSNIRYTSKYLVASDQQTGTTTKAGISEEEKIDIRRKMETAGENIFPLRSMVNIRRFVENYSNLQLKEEYLHNYFLVGSMYNIPRDVLEAYNSATYENQEKARAGHVSYTLSPKGDTFMNGFENHFGYKELGRNIYVSWEHLPFVQIFENDKLNAKKTAVTIMKELLTLGVPIEEVNEFLGTEFTITEEEDALPVSEDNQTTSGTNQETDGTTEGTETETDPADQEVEGAEAKAEATKRDHKKIKLNGAVHL